MTQDLRWLPQYFALNLRYLSSSLPAALSHFETTTQTPLRHAGVGRSWGLFMLHGASRVDGFVDLVQRRVSPRTITLVPPLWRLPEARPFKQDSGLCAYRSFRRYEAPRIAEPPFRGSPLPWFPVVGHRELLGTESYLYDSSIQFAHCRDCVPSGASPTPPVAA